MQPQLQLQHLLLHQRHQLQSVAQHHGLRLVRHQLQPQLQRPLQHQRPLQRRGERQLGVVRC